MDDRTNPSVDVDGYGDTDTDAEALAAVDEWGRRAGAALRHRAPAQAFDDVVRRGRHRQQARRTLGVGAVALTSVVLVAGVAMLRAANDSEPSSPPPPPSTVPSTPSVAASWLLLGTSGGDIVGFDVATGESSVVVGGPSRDSSPYASPDGTRFLFERTDGSEPWALWVADIDRDPRRVLTSPGRRPVWIEWAPDGRRVLTVDGSGDAAITDVDSGDTTVVDLTDPISSAGWVSGDRLLAVTRTPAGVRYVITDEAGSTTTELSTADGAIEQYSIASDGSRFAYTTWGDDPAEVGRIHVLDLETATDTVLTPPGDGFEWQAPVFSADGRWIKLDRYDATDTPLQVVLLPVDEPGDAVLVGPAGPPGLTQAAFSPDSTSLAIQYASGEAHLFDLSTMTGGPVDMPAFGSLLSWLANPASEPAGS